jgi:hypothetical protein
MRRHHFSTIVALAAVSVVAFTAVGCGDDDTTAASTTTSIGEDATQSVNAAVASCNDEAQQLGGVAGTALQGACTAVGDTATQAISAGGENVAQALSQAAETCRKSVADLPAGQAQNALSQLCDAVDAAA